MGADPPVLAVTQGDPAGIGPEIVVKAALGNPTNARLVLIAERAALQALRPRLPAIAWERLVYVDDFEGALELPRDGGSIAVLDPVGRERSIEFGTSRREDARGALAAIDGARGLAATGLVDAMVTAPVSKASIASHCEMSFRGHTEYLAAQSGLARYGHDYLMAFLSDDLQVALLSTHLPLREAVEAVNGESIVAALRCLSRHAGGRIAVAGLNPHAGEGGLLGDEEKRIIAPAVAKARALGVDAHGPESADSLFARARRGEFDWVLALYHDQGLIAVKTIAFGNATNWTLGLPYLRTSVDHGTAFGIAGRGIADETPLLHVLETTVGLIDGSLPRKQAR